MHGIEASVVVLLVGALAAGALARAVRLPTLVGFLVGGVVLGPPGLGWVEGGETLAGIAEVGVVLLLFAIGAEFSVARIRRSGPALAAAGFLQVSLTAGLGAGLGAAVGRPWRESLALGLALSLSSTALVLKLLAERKEIEAPHGRAAVGILVVQDLLVVPILLAMPYLAGGAAEVPFAVVTLRGAGFVLAAILLDRYVLPPLLERITRTRSRDLLVLAGLALCLGGAASSAAMGLSPGLGAFVAGVLLAGSPYGLHLAADLAPLRDLAVAVFFVALGASFEPAEVVARPFETAALLLFLWAGKGVAAAAATRAAGFPRRIAVETGLCLAQAGEFSFVVLAAAEALGLVSPAGRSVGGAAILLSLLLAVPSIALAGRLRRRHGLAEPLAAEGPAAGGTLVVGLGPAGLGVAKGLQEDGVEIVGVDLNPANVEAARAAGVPAVYGDAILPDVLRAAGLSGADLVVVTIPDPIAVEVLLDRLRAERPGLPVVVRARYVSEIRGYARLGATAIVAEEERVAEGLLEAARRVRDEGPDRPREAAD